MRKDHTEKKTLITEIISYVIMFLFLGYCLLPGLTFFYSEANKVILTVLMALLVFINHSAISKRFNSGMIVFLTMSFVAFVLSFINGNSPSGFLCLVQFLACTLVFMSINIRKRQYLVTMAMVFVIWLVFVIKAPNVWQQYLMDVNSIYNPNIVGLGISMSCILIYVFATKLITNRTRGIIFRIALLALSSYCIYLTQCRTAFVITLVFPFLLLFKNIIFKHRIIITAVIVAIGSIWPIIYVTMYREGIKIESTIMSEKSIYSGRQALWEDALEHIDESEVGWIIGANNNYTDYSLKASNLHNWYLTIYFSFGLIFMVAYFIYFIILIKKMNDPQYCLFLIVLSIIGFIEVCAGARNITQVFMFICFMLQSCKIGNTFRVDKKGINETRRIN